MVEVVEEKRVELGIMDLVAHVLLLNVCINIVQEVQTVVVWVAEETISTQEDLDVVDLQ
jgi:hypothetical protein